MVLADATNGGFSGLHHGIISAGGCQQRAENDHRPNWFECSLRLFDVQYLKVSSRLHSGHFYNRDIWLETQLFGFENVDFTHFS